MEQIRVSLSSWFGRNEVLHSPESTGDRRYHQYRAQALASKAAATTNEPTAHNEVQSLSIECQSCDDCDLQCKNGLMEEQILSYILEWHGQAVALLLRTFPAS